MSSGQKAALQNLDQEHTLLIAEQGQLELVAYRQIERDGPARAFVFRRKAKIYVVFWHMSGEASLEIPLAAGTARLMPELGKAQTAPKIPGGIRVPLAGRMYLECEGVSHETIVRAFRNARILD